MALRYFEDFVVGETIALGRYPVSEEEIIAFARQYDPQSFHTDPVAAATSSFGTLVASGWHTCAIFMRLFVDAAMGESAAIASPGADELRWLRPVKPGDILSGQVTMLAATPSRSRPDRGTVTHRGELWNQNGDGVMTILAKGIFWRRPG